MFYHKQGLFNITILINYRYFNMKNLVLLYVLLQTSIAYSQDKDQQQKNDTIKPLYLKEVIVIGKHDAKKLNNEKQVKHLSSLDEYLEKSTKIGMIKRGNYAWEPTINNMLSDRTNITIDGMQIFGACTDKMDPITSYVDISNLSEAHISSGQQGTENGQTIGGAIDLKLDKSGFEKTGTSLTIGIESGFETNAKATFLGTELNYSTTKFYLNTDFSYRNAGNYYNGNSTEVLYSQFTKYNFSATSGYKIAANKTLMASIIYDEARDVGYPALPMDVSLAKAIIASVSYRHKNISSTLKETEIKLYTNSIHHIMDDTTRPNVAIHMDMPGWSTTHGFYAKSKIEINKHKLLFNFNGYYNKSLAEMTMYPKDKNENLMFMLTWPDVRTVYTGIYLEDYFSINPKNHIKISSRIGYQNAAIADDFGLGSLQIFYPNLNKTKTRILPSISVQYNHNTAHKNYIFSVGYGERAPSVSEAYGNFLFNSFDNFDYIGNPNLKNEKSLEANVTFKYKKGRSDLTLENSLFYISDYIIGQINNNYNPMVIGANGVKVYTALDHAMLFNTSLRFAYKITPRLESTISLAYAIGKDNNDENLPLISPFSYTTSLNYNYKLFTTSLEMVGAAEQTAYNPSYGEDKTKAYTLLNWNAGCNFYFGTNKLITKLGIENISNVNYSTYSDWQNIPRMGRNVFLNLSYTVK